MKMFVAVALSSLIAFSLGYFVRGYTDQAQIESGGSDSLSSSGLANEADQTSRTGPAAQADPEAQDETTPVATDANAVLQSTSSTPLQILIANKRKQLGDFFLINGVDSDRANQILQALVDADHSRIQKQNAMIDQRMADQAQNIAEGRPVDISLTKEERESLRAEKEDAYREIFAEFYPAYQDYERSYQQREAIQAFSTSLSAPLDYAAKESMVQIMFEENSATRSNLVAAYTQAGGDEHEMYDANLRERRSFNERVLARAKPYLTSSQFEQFKKMLDDDLRRTELQFELSRVGSSE